MVDWGKRKKSADIMAEGLYIASAATRLRLKNSILVHILAEGRDFDSERFRGDARDVLTELADEAEADGQRAGREKKQASGRFTDSDGTHDYRSRDVRNLRRRQKQSLGIAKELRRRSEDTHELDKLVEGARDAAWSEVEYNLNRTLRIEAARPDLDGDYETMRAARMQALRLVDIPKLRAHRRSVQKQQAMRAAGEAPPPSIEQPRARGVDLSELE